MLDEAEERYLGIMLENYQDLRRRLSDVHVAIDNNVHDIERDIDHPELMADHLKRIVSQNSYIASCGLIFKRNYYPSMGSVFIPCARKDANDSVTVTRIDSTYRSEFNGKWFDEQLKKNENEWTKPYYESQMFAGNEQPRQLTTYTVPIHNRQGETVAILGGDLSLKDMGNRLTKEVKLMRERYEQGEKHHSYIIIVDKNGTYVYHPDTKRMMTSMDSRVGRAMKSNYGSCVTDIDGITSWMYYRGIQHINWVMVIVIPKDMIMANAHRLNIIIIVVMLTGLAAIFLFCRRQIKGIADPFSAQKAVLDRELTIAHNIQMALLPKPFAGHALFSLHASLTPARDVGGDLYDYFLNKNRLFLCIGDVSGKGIPADLLMAVMKAMFRSEARRADSASDIVQTMNHNLCEEYTGGDFVTMFVGILDLNTGLLDYCNAGHEPPIVTGQPLPVIINLPVGALADWTYEGQQTYLQPSDMLFLYTDGLSEAKSNKNQQFGRKHVLLLAQEHTDDTPQQLVDTMEAAAHSHAGGADQSDDITLLAIRWEQPSVQETIVGSLSIRASMQDIGLLDDFVADASTKAGLDAKEARRLRLAVEEAVANIINYGHATAITLQATEATLTHSQAIVITIDDDGLPFDPTQGSSTDLTMPADQRPPGGMGIVLIHQMADGLSYQRTDGHNILTIRKTINKK